MSLRWALAVSALIHLCFAVPDTASVSRSENKSFLQLEILKPKISSEKKASVLRSASVSNRMKNQNHSEELTAAQPQENETAGALQASLQVVYPDSARKERLEGEVRGRALFDEQGRMRDFQIVAADSPVFVRAVMQALRQFNWPKAGWENVHIVFRLDPSQNPNTRR